MPSFLTTVGDTLFFSATDRNGQELWKSDATGKRVVMVKDINAGSGDGIWLDRDFFPSEYPQLAAAGDTLFFVGDDGSTGHELWKSDGTAAGTVLVRDIFPGGLGSLSFSPAELTAVGDTLFFTANGGSTGDGLWKSDGTAAGTVLVGDILGGDLTAVGDTLFFGASEADTGYELWKSDGTAAGTVLVRDINPGPDGSRLFELTAVGDTLFFTAFVPGIGCELWKSEPPYTDLTTTLVRDINPADVGDFCDRGSRIRWLTAVGDTLFFTANDGSTGVELWKSDGTAGGTVLVRDINRWGYSNPSELTAVGDTLFFSANDGQDPTTDGGRGRELWKSDGTTAGTNLVKDINPRDGSSSPLRLTAVGETLFFAAFVPGIGHEPWRSDGTEAGTVLVADIRPGEATSSPGELTALGNTLFFAADEERKGRELWMALPPG